MWMFKAKSNFLATKLVELITNADMSDGLEWDIFSKKETTKVIMYSW